MDGKRIVTRGAMFLLSLVAGYATLVLLITVVQEWMFGGVSYQTTPRAELVAAGALTTISALAGGCVAAWLFGKPWPALAMCGLVVLETFYLIRTNRVDGPLWFDVLASASLVVGILAGAWAVQRWKGRVSPLANS